MKLKSYSLELKTYSLLESTKIEILIENSTHDVLIDSFTIHNDIIIFTLGNKEQYSCQVQFISSVLSSKTVTEIIRMLIKGCE